MIVNPDIPDSVAASLRLPVPEIEPRLRAELVLGLCAQQMFSPISSPAAKFPGHYSEEEPAQDPEYAEGGQPLIPPYRIAACPPAPQSALAQAKS